MEFRQGTLSVPCVTSGYVADCKMTSNESFGVMMSLLLPTTLRVYPRNGPNLVVGK